MVDEISERIDDWLPSDVTDRAEIERAIDDTGWQNDWDPGTTDAVADAVAAGRDIDTAEFAEAERKQTTLAGQQDARTAQVQAADGTFLGKPGNVRTWEDRWGNIMAEGANGRRRKLKDSEDR